MLKLDQLKTALTDKKKLSEDLEAAQTKITQLEGELATAQQSATAEKTRADELQAQIEQVNSTLEELNGKVTTLETEKKTLSQATVEKLHELGVPAAELPQAGTTPVNDDQAVYEKWQSLTGGEKTKFFRENIAALERYAASQQK